MDCCGGIDIIVNIIVLCFMGNLGWLANAVVNNINLLNLICCFEIKWLANAAVVPFSFESFNVIYQMLIQITKNRTLMTIILEENKIIDPYAKFTLSSEN